MRMENSIEAASRRISIQEYICYLTISYLGLAISVCTLFWIYGMGQMLERRVREQTSLLSPAHVQSVHDCADAEDQEEHGKHADDWTDSD